VIKDRGREVQRCREAGIRVRGPYVRDMRQAKTDQNEARTNEETDEEGETEG
jgi:hypothetical protein